MAGFVALLFISALACSLRPSAASLTSPVSELRVEGLVLPLAVGARTPRFSWVTGAEQLTYRVLVTELASGAVAWDSGVVVDRLARRAVWAAVQPAKADADYSWTVQVELQGLGLQSASGSFSTAPLAQALEAGQWLGGADTLRTSFGLDSNAVTRARLHITGLGCYHVYVNGQRLSSELSPGFAFAPNARVPYDTYDVARILKPGNENVVGVRLGTCKYGYLGSYCKGTPRECNKAWVLLSVVQGDNNTVIPSSPDTWTSKDGPIQFQHLYHGERFDARLEEVGWDAPGFSGSPSWRPAFAMDASDLGPLEPSTYGAVVRTAPLEAKSITQPGDGSYLFDFGTNRAGICTLNVTGRPGATVTMVYTEILYANGSAQNTYVDCVFGNISDCANQTVSYTLAGRQAPEVHTPHFFYAGFRYVAMWGWPGPAAPPPSALTCYFVYSELAPAGDAAFDPSTPQGKVLNALQASTVATHLSNLVSLPTDCNQREKRGWTGDAQLTAHSACLNFDMKTFYENWHRTMLDQQRLGCVDAGGPATASRPPNWECNVVPVSSLPTSAYLGSIGDVVPQGYSGMGLWPGDVTWEVAAIIIPAELLSQYGDVDYLAATYDGPRSSIQFFNTLATADPKSGGLVPWSYLGDWIAIDTPSRYLVANVHYAIGALLAADIAKAVGKAADATAFVALASLVSSLLPGKFWNASKGYWDAGSQSAQVLPLVWGLGGNATTAGAQAQLLRDIADRGTHLSVGAAGARYLLQALQAAGRSDVALALATTTTYPSWGYFVSDPAFPGTIWEGWGGNATFADGSKNHIFKAGGLGSWMYEGALGLAFAYRPQEGADLGAPLCPGEEVLGLPLLSARSRIGLSCAEVAAAASVVKTRLAQAKAAAAAGPAAELDTAAVFGLPTLVPDVEAELAARGREGGAPPMRAPLAPRLGLSVDSSAARVLRKAAGWRSTPVGNASFSWHFEERVPRLSLEALVPFGVQALLELPLGLQTSEEEHHNEPFRAARKLTLKLSSGQDSAVQNYILLVDVAAGTVQVDNSANGLPLTVTLAPLGTAAAFVDGRPTAVCASGAETIHLRTVDCTAIPAALLFHLAGGRHAVEIASSPTLPVLTV